MQVEEIIRAASPNALVTSTWTLVEFASALTRLKRMNHLEGDPRHIVATLEAHARSVYVIFHPDSQDFQVARELLLHELRLPLRGPDALHLAVVLRQAETLYTLDQKLLECAQVLGIPATDAGVLDA